jgi:hypothetical protein
VARWVAALAIAAGLAACGDDEQEQPAGAAATDLVVHVDRDGSSGAQQPRAGRVRCKAGDSSPACTAVGRLRVADFAPVPDNVACTQQYGGPDIASVTGTLRGERIDAEFSRTDGCEISRWDGVAPLLEAATG